MLELNEIHNPFPGIRPFEMDETNLFFGRDGQSDELLKRLQRTRLLAVVGTSGSGKSSLIRAGLLPALYGGLMGDAGSSWRIAIHRPGGDPIGNLASALADPQVFGLESNSEIQTALIETTLRRSSIGLIDVTREARMSAPENLLVVVDQFEELFRFKQSQTGDDATTFVKLLLEASAQQEIPIYIIITMRSDFLGDCSQFTGLPEAINNGQYLIPRMSRDERQSAIVGPIAVGEGQISAPLVSRLLNDVGDSPDQLPILQHALMRTWDYWSAHRLNGNPIDLDDYTAIGTMSEALSRHADEAFNELPDERSRLIAERLFKRLTEKGMDNREIRRPTPLSELCAVCAATESELIAIVDVFRAEGRSFLMPPVGAKLTSETVVDISHESLIRNWQRLQRWVDEEAQSSRIYRRLAEAAVLHREGSEGLLQDPGLQIALDWFEKNKPNAAWAQRYHPEFDEAKKYLEVSCEAREAAQLERERQRNAELERERREREQAEIYAAAQARANRKLRLLMVALGLMLVLAMATAAYAFAARRQAKTSELVALGLRDQAVKREGDLSAALTIKERAEQQRVIADAARAEADKAAKKAEAGREAALRDAQEKAKIAETEKIKAQREEKRFQDEARRNKKAKEANDAFREAALNVQRGKYQSAKDFFFSAIELYQDPDVANEEGVADATVEIGNLALAVGKQTYAQNHNFGENNVMGNLEMAIGKYDAAAKIYAGPEVNAVEKAAATNFSLAISLLPLANGTLTKASLAKASLRSDADYTGWTGAEGEVPELNLIPTTVSATNFTNLTYDPVTRLKDETVKHLDQALRQYRQVFEAHKDVTGDWRADASRIGIQKAAYQLGDFYLKKSIEEAASRAYKTDEEREKVVEYERRQAAHYFEELLSTYERNDFRRGRLLIWLGGLYGSLGEKDDNLKSMAAGYFQRVTDEMRKTGTSEAGTLAGIGSELEASGQGSEALAFYQHAGMLFANTEPKDTVRAADMYYYRGRIYEKDSNLNRASQCYDYAIGVYKNAPDLAGSYFAAGNLVAIGSFLKQVANENSALEAFDLAIKAGARFKRPDIEVYVARAYAERGAIFAQQRKSRDAINAYRLAIPIYEHIVSSDESTTEQNDDATAELRRIKLITSALENTLTTPP